MKEYRRKTYSLPPDDTWSFDSFFFGPFEAITLPAEALV